VLVEDLYRDIRVELSQSTDFAVLLVTSFWLIVVSSM
jgi:hypothetical protein